MKRASLLAAAAILVVANTFALVHAWRNRSGSIETDITLTERELPMSYNLNEDNTGVSLDLRWMYPERASFGCYIRMGRNSLLVVNLFLAVILLLPRHVGPCATAAILEGLCGLRSSP